MDQWAPSHSPPPRVMLIVGALASLLGALSMMGPPTVAESSARSSTTLFGAAFVAQPRALGSIRSVEAPDDPEPSDGIDTGAPPIRFDPTPPDVVLVATSVSPNPRLHTVALRRRDAAVSKFLNLGDRVDGYVVKVIDRREVTLEAPDGTGWIYSLSFYPDDVPEPRRVGEPEPPPRERGVSEEAEPSAETGDTGL
ncbi:MAG: hypothetical protein AAGA48_02990 [Myxococcota bacterium]